MVLLWGIPSIKAVLDKGTKEFEVVGLHNAVVKKVSKPEDGVKKSAAVTTEADKLLVSLPATEPKLAGAITLVSDLKGLQEKFVLVEQGLAGQGAVLTEERNAGFSAIAKKTTELQKLVKDDLEKNQIVPKDQFKPLLKALTDQLPVRTPAKYKFNFWSAAGTAILIAAFLSALICGVSLADTFRILRKTLYDMRYPAVTVASVLGLAYVMNFSGMTNCLGLIFTKTGHWFPFIAPFLGWLGVFLTGSDTSSNVLFGGLQKATAEQLGLNPILMGAANTSGGVMGKMISPQSLAVATAACGMVGEEGTLFRFTFKHSIFLTVIVGIIVYLQAYYLQWMVP
jgi:lactate permease